MKRLCLWIILVCGVPFIPTASAETIHLLCVYTLYIPGDAHHEGSTLGPLTLHLDIDADRQSIDDPQADLSTLKFTNSTISWTLKDKVHLRQKLIDRTTGEYREFDYADSTTQNMESNSKGVCNKAENRF